MTVQEFKRVARLLKELYKELEKEVLDGGGDIFSQEFTELQSVVREKVLARLGFTIEEYRQAKELVAPAKRIDVEKEFSEVHKKIDEAYKKSIPSKEEIESVAEEVAKRHIKPPIITHQVVKETTIEKPTIIKETVTEIVNTPYNDGPIRAELGYLNDLFNQKKQIPNESLDDIDLNKFKEQLRTEFDSTLKESIDILGMPNFRKLAMGLEGRISTLEARPVSTTTWYQEAVTGTINSSNVTFTLAHTLDSAASVQLYLGHQLQVQTVDYSISGTTITYVVAPDISLSGDHYAFYGVGVAGGGGGTPGGTTTQIQYNNAGAFGGFGAWDGTNIRNIGGIYSSPNTDLVLNVDNSGSIPNMSIGANAGFVSIGGLTTSISTALVTPIIFPPTGSDLSIYTADATLAKHINVTAANSVGGNNNGGDIVLRAGSKNGFGTDGSVKIRQIAVAGNNAIFNAESLSADRTLTLPNETGTLSLTSRTISTTAPLAGGGDLSADRTLTTSMATNKLIGRSTAGTGVMEEITLGTGLSLSGTTLNASITNTIDVISYQSFS